MRCECLRWWWRRVREKTNVPEFAGVFCWEMFGVCERDWSRTARSEKSCDGDVDAVAVIGAASVTGTEAARWDWLCTLLVNPVYHNCMCKVPPV